MLKRFVRRILHGEQGITGLETAIILIAFVVVAAVFAYTVLSAGLFSSQQSQESIYSGLRETQSTLEMKGSVVAIGKAQMNSLDYVGWVADANATLTRNTTTKWQGSGALEVVVGTDMAQDETIIYHAMEPMNLSEGDTLSFWMRADAALDGNISFVLATGPDLDDTAIQSYVIDTSGTGWEKHSFSLGKGAVGEAAYYGVVLSTDAEGTFFLDRVIFENVAAYNGVSVLLNNCDYVGWEADANATIARETTDKMEGAGISPVRASRKYLSISISAQPRTEVATGYFFVISTDGNT